MNNWINPKTKQLFEALLENKNIDEMASFCRDLMTESEILEFAGRLDVAIELSKGISQRDVSKKTGISIATVTRVNKWLKNGLDGYRLVISRLSHNHPPQEEHK